MRSEVVDHPKIKFLRRDLRASWSELPIRCSRGTCRTKIDNLRRTVTALMTDCYQTRSRCDRRLGGVRETLTSAGPSDSPLKVCGIDSDLAPSPRRLAPSLAPVKECNTVSFRPLPSLKTVFQARGAVGVRGAIKIAARIQSRCVLGPDSVRGILSEAIRWKGILESPLDLDGLGYSHVACCASGAFPFCLGSAARAAATTQPVQEGSYYASDVRISGRTKMRHLSQGLRVTRKETNR